MLPVMLLFTMANEGAPLPRHPAPMAAELVDLADVRVLAGPLKAAQDADARYLLELNPHGFLNPYRRAVWLPPKAPFYGGWESRNGGSAGEILGHYLTAVSEAWAVTGDRRFKEKADYDRQSWMLGPFVREERANPVLKPDPAVTFADPMTGQQTPWEHDNVFNPAAAVKNGRLCLLFRAEDASGEGIGAHTSRVGFANSADGLHFTVRHNPVLFPTNDAQKPFDWPGGCEDPRVVRGPAQYVMTYTAWNKHTARLSVATSPDLIHWRKRGPAFGRAGGGKWLSLWCKSGSIVTRRRGSDLVATKIKGKYWMYFGDKDVSAATSTNLVDWTPVTERGGGKILAVLRPRDGHFDSALCEPGPPAVVTRRGIVLLYNGSNAAHNGDPLLPAATYCAGQALLDKNDPKHLLDRTGTPFLKPERPYEVTGQYKNGTVFIEGLAWFHRHWVLAYGTADSMVALARTQ